jgi:hypothetical protein
MLQLLLPTVFIIMSVFNKLQYTPFLFKSGLLLRICSFMFVAPLLFIALQKVQLYKNGCTQQRYRWVRPGYFSPGSCPRGLCLTFFYVYGVPNSYLERCTEYLNIQILLTYVLQAGLLWRRIVIVQISTMFLRSAACVPPITCDSTLHYDIGVPESCT